MGNAPNRIRHWLHRDLYTQYQMGPRVPPETDEEGWMGGRTYTMQVGDSMLVGHTLLTIDSLRAVGHEKPERGLLQKDLGIAACVSLKNKERDTLTSRCTSSVTAPSSPISQSRGYGIKMRIETFDPQAETLEIVWERIGAPRFCGNAGFIFPLINVLWLGCILMAIGTFMAVWARWKTDTKSRPHG